MSRVITLLNQKGGVGKSTAAVNLAAVRAEVLNAGLPDDAEPRVAAVSIDPQGSAAWWASQVANLPFYLIQAHDDPLEHLAMLNSLTGIDEVPICTGYDVDGVIHREMPMTQTEFHHAKPIFEHFDGWTEDISGAREFTDLPLNAQRYVEALEKLSGCRISAIGVGPGRDQVVQVRDLIDG